MALKENDPGLEIIAVKIGNRIRGNYEGLAGTFASFVYCCLDKRIMPGFHEQGLIAEAELKDGGLLLVLSGRHTETELTGIMDIALLNIGAYLGAGASVKYIIEIKSKN